MAASVGAAGFGADVRSGMAAAAAGGGGGDIEYGNEATPAGFFSADFKRYVRVPRVCGSRRDGTGQYGQFSQSPDVGLIN